MILQWLKQNLFAPNLLKSSSVQQERAMGSLLVLMSKQYNCTNFNTPLSLPLINSLGKKKYAMLTSLLPALPITALFQGKNPLKTLLNLTLPGVLISWSPTHAVDPPFSPFFIAAPFFNAAT